MGKSRLNKKQVTLNRNEGKMTCSFQFDGKLYQHSHQLTASEMSHMKNLCRQYGDLAAEQVIWRVAIKGMGMVAENILAKAAIDYIKKHKIVPVPVSEPVPPVFDKEPTALELVEEIKDAYDAPYNQIHASRSESNSDGGVSPATPQEVDDNSGIDRTNRTDQHHSNQMVETVQGTEANLHNPLGEVP